VFLDADRANYLTYLETVLPKVTRGGLIVADNVTSHPEELAAYLARVKSHLSLFSVTVPVGKGEEISYKLS
jgi:predicted O-methyltransferase YrrM